MPHIDFTNVNLVLAVALAVAGCKETKTDTAKAVDQQKVAEEVSFNTLLKKAESGDPQAQLELGTRYALGEGVQVENSEALKWWTKASEQNNMDALYYLGYAYRYGIGARDPSGRNIYRRKESLLLLQNCFRSQRTQIDVNPKLVRSGLRVCC